MTHYCPIYGEWCDYYSKVQGGYRFQSDSQAGAVDQTIIDEWETVPIPPAPGLKSVVIRPENQCLTDFGYGDHYLQ